MNATVVRVISFAVAAWSVCFASMVCTASLARAQSPSPVCVVILSDDAEPRVSSAIRVELQLSGCRVALHRVAAPVDEGDARELAAHAGAEVFEVRRNGIRRVEPGGRELHEPVEDNDPHALAAIAGWLRSRPFTATSHSVPRSPPRIAHPFQLAPPTPLAEPARLDLSAAGPQTLSRPEPPPPAPERPMPVEERVAWELLGGVGAGVALGAAAAGIAGVFAPAGDPFEWWAVGLVAGGTVGVGLGVLLAGRLTGFDGDAAWTLLGSLLGGVLAGGMLALGYAVDRSPTDGIDTGFNFLGAALAVVAPPLFSVLAFELTIPQ